MVRVKETMSKSGIKSKLFRVLLVLYALMLAVNAILAGGALFAQEDRGASISSYNVTVRINEDGAADVTENVKFSFRGSFNNVMLLIDKKNEEVIEIQKVYMLRKNGYQECVRLSEGQWDAEVFSGTYSVLDEAQLVKLKVYGSFTNTYGSIIVQYRVLNAVKRYGDVAEYTKTHIPAQWDSRVSNISVAVYLPQYTDMEDVTPYLHGVFVGKKNVESRRNVTYQIPDTVPGEYVETRVVFPSSLLSKVPYTDNRRYSYLIRQQEAIYNASDKPELLEAREAAARAVGLKALREKVQQHIKTAASLLSVLSAVGGIWLLMYLRHKLRPVKKDSLNTPKQPSVILAPAQVALLVTHGKTGARALMGTFFSLAARGRLLPLVKEDPKGKPVLAFNSLFPGEKEDREEGQKALTPSEVWLLKWMKGYERDEGAFYPSQLMKEPFVRQEAFELKQSYDIWERHVRQEYEASQVLDEETAFWRKIGLMAGTVLLFLGFYVSVSLSIWSGYAMIPPGVLLFFYSLNILKHTEEGRFQYRLWRNLRYNIGSKGKWKNRPPEWLPGGYEALGYSYVLGGENNTQWLSAIISGLPEDFRKSLAKGEGDGSILLKEAYRGLNSIVSSVQDEE